MNSLQPAVDTVGGLHHRAATARWWMAAAVGAVLLLVIGYVVMWEMANVQTQFMLNRLEAAAEQTLPDGADRPVIEQFFTRNGFEFEYVSGYGISVEHGHKLPLPGANAYLGSLRFVAGPLRVQERILAYIYLDAHDHLVGYEIERVWSGP